MTSQTRSLPAMIFAFLISMLLFLPPILRGLFFEHEFFYILGLSAIALLVFYFCVYIREPSVQRFAFPSALLDWGAIFLVAAYALSVFVAVNPRDAIGEFLRQVNYVIIYFVISRSIRQVLDIERYLKIVYWSGVTVSLAGLGALVNFWHFVGDLVGVRISSTLQYPNTLAVFLTFIILAGVFLGRRQKGLYYSLYQMTNYFIWVAFFGSQSRGGYLVAAIILVLYLLMIPAREKLAASVTIGLNAGLAMFTLLNLTGVKQADIQSNWYYLLIGAILTFALSAVVSKYKGSIRLADNKKAYLGLLVIVTLALIGSLVVADVNLLPKRILTLFDKDLTQATSVAQRLYYAKDALQVIKDYPVLGTGGNGWASVMPQYRSYFYVSKNLHNYYLQTWVEAGTVGLLAFLIILLGFIKAFIRLYTRFNEDDDRAVVVMIGLGCLAILVHSLIDFNMSFGSIAMLLWFGFGCLTSIDNLIAVREESSEKFGSSKVIYLTKVTVATLCIITLMASVSFRLAISYSITGSEQLSAGNLDAAISNLQTASRFDPYKASYRAGLAQALFEKAQQNGDEKTILQGLEHANKAITYDQGNPDLHMIKANFLLGQRDITKGVTEVELAYKLDPWNVERYENLAFIYTNAAKYMAVQGKPKEAAAYIRKALDVPQKMKDQQKKLSKDELRLWKGVPKLTLTPKLLKNIIEAKELYSVL